MPPNIDGVVAAVLRPGPRPPGLTGRFYYFEDPSARLTFADVRSSAFAQRFQLADSDNVNLGYTDSALWLRIDIRAVPGSGGSWMLTLDYPLLDHIEVYDAVSHDDQPLLRLGDRHPFAERVVPLRSFTIPLAGQGPWWRRVYLRVQTESALVVRPGLIPERELLLQSSREEFLFGLAYGVMLLMAAYNLFLFLGLRDVTYLFYVASTLFAGGFLMSLNGHGAQYLWPRSPTLANLGNPVFASLWVAATAGFARLFLDPARRSPGAALAINLLIALGLAGTTIALVASHRPAIVLGSLAGTLNAVVLLACGALMWKRGLRAARFFTLAWIGVGLGILSLAASRFGLMADNALTRNGVMWSAVCEMLLLSFALSDKYRLMQVELEAHSKRLESTVADRTQQLVTANAELQRLAVTDALTGVANRRRFEETLQEEYARHRRIEAALSLAMVDIDHFKQINDGHGHPFGDRCLRKVAAAILSTAQRSADVVARYGGEEFAVLLPHTDGAAAQLIGERICQAVRALKLTPVRGAADVPVTVSIGVATWDPRAEGSGNLVAAADRALYEAKRGGRDRVITALVGPGGS